MTLQDIAARPGGHIPALVWLGCAGAGFVCGWYARQASTRTPVIPSAWSAHAVMAALLVVGVGTAVGRAAAQVFLVGGLAGFLVLGSWLVWLRRRAPISPKEMQP